MHAPARRPDREAGFTVVEAMVAMVILIVAVLGTLTMLQGGLASTRQTASRVQATNLARDLVERSRQVSYQSLSVADAPATLRATLPAADNASALNGSSFKVTRNNVLYKVTISACSIDDPTDGAGVGDATFCADPTSSASGSAPAAAVNVLGVAVTAGGSIIDTVCKALGNPALLNRVTSVVSVVTPVSVCPAGTGPAGGNVNLDTRPDDLRRVRISVTWNSGRAEHVTQTTLLTNSLA